jgi:hypothetical protein
MKCASAKAGIASVMTGLAVVLSAAPAHATFIYLTQSSAISASSVAPFVGRSATLDRKHSRVYEDFAPVASQTQDHTHGEMILAGLQSQSAGDYEKQSNGSDAGSGSNASYSAPFAFRWSNARDVGHANGALPWNLPDSTLTSALKDSPSGLGGVTAPSVPVATAPVANTNNPTPPSPPNEANEIGVPPIQTTPVVSPPTEAPIVGVPSKTVPEPSTVGLLGIGLLLIFAGISRGKRARYYSNVSGSPRSSRQMGSLARSLNRDSWSGV